MNTESEQRDLHADLAICNAATSGSWIVDAEVYVVILDGSKPEGRGDFIAECDKVEDARFIEVAHIGWPHAIERCISAEEENERLREIVSVESPIGAFDIATSLRAEKAHMAEHITELESEVEQLRGELMYVFQKARNDIARWDGGQCVELPVFADRVFARRFARDVEPLLFMGGER